mmetsp:Transcript_54161/g.131433  ORF Transcript_54161/g.131433 Transcript_54161/m.131433 type:complete len:253 (+) Transcript_54161:435-1193(+)
MGVPGTIMYFPSTLTSFFDAVLTGLVSTEATLLRAFGVTTAAATVAAALSLSSSSMAKGGKRDGTSTVPLAALLLLRFLLLLFLFRFFLFLLLLDAVDSSVDGTVAIIAASAAATDPPSFLACCSSWSLRFRLARCLRKARFLLLESLAGSLLAVSVVDAAVDEDEIPLTDDISSQLFALIVGLAVVAWAVVDGFCSSLRSRAFTVPFFLNGEVIDFRIRLRGDSFTTGCGLARWPFEAVLLIVATVMFVYC